MEVNAGPLMSVVVGAVALGPWLPFAGNFRAAESDPAVALRRGVRGSVSSALPSPWIPGWIAHPRLKSHVMRICTGF